MVFQLLTIWSILSFFMRPKVLLQKLWDVILHINLNARDKELKSTTISLRKNDFKTTKKMSTKNVSSHQSLLVSPYILCHHTILFASVWRECYYRGATVFFNLWLSHSWLAIGVMYFYLPTITGTNFQGLNKLGFFDFDLSQLATKAAFYFLDDIESIIIPSPGESLHLYKSLCWKFKHDFAVSTGIAEVGFNCPTIKDLPRDYAEFVNDPISKGTILVAFGSNVVWDYAPQYTLDTFTDAMNRLREYRYGITVRLCFWVTLTRCNDNI